MKRFIVGCLIFVASVTAAWAQDEARFPTIGGQARIVDGDTIAFGRQRVRFYGIDAPESSQVCDVGDRAWRCGAAARDVLAQAIANRPVQCVVHDTDRYGRRVAVCFNAEGEDLNRFMVDQGLAVAYTRYSPRYAEDEQQAKRRGLGIWGGPFERPDAYRHGENQGPADVASDAAGATDEVDSDSWMRTVQNDLTQNDSSERIPQDTTRATFKGMACVVLGKGCRTP